MIIKTQTSKNIKYNGVNFPTVTTYFTTKGKFGLRAFVRTDEEGNSEVKVIKGDGRTSNFHVFSARQLKSEEVSEKLIENLLAAANP